MFARNARGFTLIEVVIATGLLITLCAGVSMLLTRTLASIDRSRHREMAMVLARAKVEQLVSVSSRVMDGGDFLDAQGESVSADAGAMYERRWSIERRGSELLIVQVMVTPRGQQAVWISGARVRRGP